MERPPNSSIQLPPVFRFHPADKELVVHYLRNKVFPAPIPASIIVELDLYKYKPWELQKKSLFGENEWFFFTPRDRK
ncbi:NAC domain [Dillenia turbinata]|uniref:NAC domain n=1 Tax=Dillenia turbinata TaxID=194707 RepID=A0AAN8VZT9_9MAGN